MGNSRPRRSGYSGRGATADPKSILTQPSFKMYCSNERNRDGPRIVNQFHAHSRKGHHQHFKNWATNGAFEHDECSYKGQEKFYKQHSEEYGAYDTRRKARTAKKKFGKQPTKWEENKVEYVRKGVEGESLKGEDPVSFCSTTSSDEEFNLALANLFDNCEVYCSGDLIFRFDRNPRRPYSPSRDRTTFTFGATSLKNGPELDSIPMPTFVIN
eukprot:TRINITY_DN399_c0_g2_i1.p1 TRINITY_DN399_c0_g2~~TRINITY_DN399_c0_g2_i1.p1  ORF type:complete len:226 (-),score=21.39 TRINITY_DN399_c0_g2_i1:234-872(-)